jgi:NAD(P)-dependent dehydrogenase (short-subunit alcohol dehydrogenase family)
VTAAQLAGQRAIVTGSVGAVGGAIASGLRDRGVEVIGLDARGGAEHVVDLRDPDGVQRQVDEIFGAGAVQILIHCAAIALERTLEQTSADDWSTVFSVNAAGTFHLFRSALPYFREQGYGRVLAVGSIATDFGYAFPAYSASKAAVVALVKSAAVQYAAYGVTVNCLSPGRIATPLAPHNSEEQLRERIPLGRAARPSEIADLAVALVDPAISYLTGSNIVCDGGMSSVFALHGLGPYDRWAPKE